MESALVTNTILAFLLLNLVCSEANGKDERCIAVQDGACIICIDSYIKNGKCIEPSYKTEFCLTYSENEDCTACKLGFFLTTDFTCEKISIPYCLEIYKYEVCTICESPMIVRNQKCDPKYTCDLKDCDVCTVSMENEEICVLCSEGFVAKYQTAGKTICVPEFGNSVNCLTLRTDDSTKCAVCDLGYYMEDGICSKSTLYDLRLSANLLKHTGLLLIITLLL